MRLSGCARRGRHGQRERGLGLHRGLALAEELEGVEALIFDAGLNQRRTSGFPPIDLRPGAAVPPGSVP